MPCYSSICVRFHITGSWSHPQSAPDMLYSIKLYSWITLLCSRFGYSFLLLSILMSINILGYLVIRCWLLSGHMLFTPWTNISSSSLRLPGSNSPTILPSRSFHTLTFKFLMKIVISCDLHWVLTLSGVPFLPPYFAMSVHTQLHQTY